MSKWVLLSFNYFPIASPLCSALKRIETSFHVGMRIQTARLTHSSDEQNEGQMPHWGTTALPILSLRPSADARSSPVAHSHTRPRLHPGWVDELEMVVNADSSGALIRLLTEQLAADVSSLIEATASMQCWGVGRQTPVEMMTSARSVIKRLLQAFLLQKTNQSNASGIFSKHGLLSLIRHQT